VTVVPTNEEPTADDDALTLAEDTSDTVDVLDGDVDDDRDPLSVETPTPAADHGTVSCCSQLVPVTVSALRLRQVSSTPGREKSTLRTEERMAVPLAAKEKRHVRAGASNENLDQVLSEIRQQAACVRDELFEAVIRPRGEPAAGVRCRQKVQPQNNRARRSAAAARPRLAHRREEASRWLRATHG
jgi:Bacterial cadherin-like domain